MTSQRASDDAKVSEVLAGGGEMGALMRATRWADTPLGPIESWSPTLRTMVGVLLRNRFPMLLLWGPSFIQLYNDAYRPILGDKHPRSMGQPCRECWAEIWPIVGPMIEAPFRGELATWSDDIELLVNRRGFLEEGHFKVAYNPVPDETVEPTGIGGVLAPVAETTEQVYGARQLKTLRELGARAAEAKTPERACEIAALTFGENSFDVPFALLYLLEPDGKRARLTSSYGFTGEDGAAHPSSIDLEAPIEESAWPVSRIVQTRAIEVVDDLKTRFDMLPRGRWSESPRCAIVLPLSAPEKPRPYGVLIAGCSPHRVLDEGYRTFFELAAGQVVTAIRNANAFEEQRLRAEKLAEIDRAKTAFFSNVSHEFRTPLTLMLGPLEDALGSEGRSLGGDSLDVVYRNALRLLKLVNTLLEFSRMEAGRVQATYEPVDLAAITTELVATFRAAIERAGLKLVLRCEPIAETVYVDKEMWAQIVLNLLSNAFKFTFEGEIEVGLRAAGDHVDLEVRDTGIGVSKDELPHLFERFYRIEGAKARTHEGSGIGLALVQEFVRLHGGEIRAESEYGKETIFTVAIPTGTAHLPPDRIARARPSAPTTARAAPFIAEALRWLPDAIDSHLAVVAHSPDARDTPGARILVVDDNADLRDYLRRILGTRWLVETAADGEAAFAAARIAPPDLILTDVMMPGLTGFGLLSALRRNPRTCTIPVIMLSARAGEEARIEGLEAGADDYLIKPFSARELIARVSSQLALGASNRERALLLERERGARREAELQKQQLFSLLTQAPTPIFILRGTDYVIEFANPNAGQVWGRPPQDLIDEPLFEALPELGGQVFRTLLDGVIRTGVPYVGKEMPPEVDPTSDGTLDGPYFHFVYLPLRNLDGEIDGVLVFAFDVSDEVLARHQMKQFRSDLEAANRARDELLAMLGQLALRRQDVELGEAVAAAIEISSPLLEERRHHVDVRIPGTVQEASEGIGRAETPAGRSGGKRILVVDDNPDTVQSLKGALEALGYTVEVAHDGPSALKAAEAFTPDIALLDIGLPVMNGYELAERLRELRGASRDLQLVAVTGYGGDADRQRSRAAGFAQHLVKPVDLAKLERVVEELGT